MKNKKTRKILNIKLDNRRLKEVYPEKNLRNAYKHIKIFLQNNGFEYEGNSEYVSKNLMSLSRVKIILRRMKNNFDWLSYCITVCNVDEMANMQDIKGIDRYFKDFKDIIDLYEDK